MSFGCFEFQQRILSRANSSFERRGLPPAEPKKVLKLHLTRDQILHLKQQNPRKFCRKEVSFVTSQFGAQHNLPARKKRIRTNAILQYKLKVSQSYRDHRFYHVNSGQEIPWQSIAGIYQSHQRSIPVRNKKHSKWPLNLRQTTMIRFCKTWPSQRTCKRIWSSIRCGSISEIYKGLGHQKHTNIPLQ